MLLGLSGLVRAQHSLEEIRIYEAKDTRCLRINNQGFVIGYTHSPIDDAEQGFVITPQGNTILMSKIHTFNTKGMAGYDHYRVVGINDRDTNVIIVRASDSRDETAACTIYKGYYNPATDGYDTFYAVPVPLSNPMATGINNRNDIVGWYRQGLSGSRWLWIWRDSLATVPPGVNQYHADRVFTLVNNNPNNPVTYRTFTGGIINGDYLVGHYYKDHDPNPQAWAPYMYRMATASQPDSFFLLSGPSHTQVELRGMHNNLVVGKRTLALNHERAFIAELNNNQLQQIYPPIFPGGGLTSEFTGINEKEEITGNYRHPVTGLWVGFIYRRHQGEYRIPGFDYARHTWKLHNSDGPPSSDSVWTSNYWGNFDYNNNDPYANNHIPLIKNTNFEHVQNAQNIAPSAYHSWRAYVLEHARYQQLSAMGWVKYNQVVKSLLLDSYVNSEIGGRHNFSGICYGFSYTVLQRYLEPAQFSQWFDLRANLPLREVPNTDTLAIMAIERTQLKQHSRGIYNRYNPHLYSQLPMWAGLYRLKSTYNLPYDRTNPRAVAITTDLSKEDGWHSVLPYKIKTPQVLPFDHPVMKYDTVFIYDSNYPIDSTEYILVKSNLHATSYTFDSAYSPLNRYGQLAALNFNKPGVRSTALSEDELSHSEYSYFSRPTNTPVYEGQLTFAVPGDSHYSLKNADDDSTAYDGTTFQHFNLDLLPKRLEDNSARQPLSFLMDTAQSVRITSSNYGAENMRWSQTNNLMSLSINRDAALNESDEGRIAHRFMQYTSKDLLTKTLHIGYTQVNENMTAGVNMQLSGLKAAFEEQLELRVLDDYQLEIIRSSGDSVRYHLSCAAIDGDDVRPLEAVVPIGGDTRHIINPYYNGPEGMQTVIYVDTRNDGSYNDTIFLEDQSNRMLQVAAGYTISLSPNPVTDQLTVQVATVDHSSPSAYVLVLSDLSGRRVLQRSLNVTSGQATLNVRPLKAGLYTVQLLGKGQTIYRSKLVKY